MNCQLVGKCAAGALLALAGAAWTVPSADFGVETGKVRPAEATARPSATILDYTHDLVP